MVYEIALVGNVHYVASSVDLDKVDVVCRHSNKNAPVSLHGPHCGMTTLMCQHRCGAVPTSATAGC